MLSTKLVLVLLLQASVVVLAKRNKLRLLQPRLDGRIVGGQFINITDAPHQISLQISQHICGGSLISDQWILTAAHCTYWKSAEMFTVRLGSAECSKNGQVHRVQKIVQHERFNYLNVDYDFALVQLQEPIIFDEAKKAVKLPEPDQVFEDGEPCLVTGWGETHSSVESHEWLRQVRVPLINHELCRVKYKIFGGVTDSMICAGLAIGGKDACQGDSGGPMINDQGVLVGVVSWGYGCARPEYPGVYSRVAIVRNWIKEHTGI